MLSPTTRRSLLLIAPSSPCRLTSVPIDGINWFGEAFPQSSEKFDMVSDAPLITKSTDRFMDLWNPRTGSGEVQIEEDNLAFRALAAQKNLHVRDPLRSLEGTVVLIGVLMIPRDLSALDMALDNLAIPTFLAVINQWESTKKLGFICCFFRNLRHIIQA